MPYDAVMSRIHTASVLLASALACAAPPLLAQEPVAAPHPSFSGTWVPSEPAKSDRWFDVGMTVVPGRGRLSIEQTGTRFVVTVSVPDDKLDPILDINGRFYTSIIFRLIEPRGRAGGYGAGGPQPTQSSWQGDRLVIRNPWPSQRPHTMTFSMDGDRLKVETHTDVGTRSSDITEWYSKLK